MSDWTPESWNTCPSCKQYVDADEVFDGSEVRCWACQKWFLVDHLGGDDWRLRPIEDGPEERR